MVLELIGHVSHATHQMRDVDSNLESRMVGLSFATSGSRYTVSALEVEIESAMKTIHSIRFRVAAWR